MRVAACLNPWEIKQISHKKVLIIGECQGGQELLFYFDAFEGLDSRKSRRERNYFKTKETQPENV